MKFSLIFGYKNREPERIKRCLESLDRQTNRDFEVVFVDYGSDQEFAISVRKIVNSFDFTQYYYNDTRGRNWNRSHALNTGIKRASGEFIITTDVDIIYPADFIEVCSAKANHKKLMHAKAYYLPESFTDYENIASLEPSKIPDTKPGQETALGLCQMVSAEKFKAINGFDEYFRIWGVEDIDVNRRLKMLGMEMEWIELDEIPLIHQWHPTSFIADDIAKAPSDWFQVMWEYHETRTEPINTAGDWGRIWESHERPAYSLVESSKLNFSDKFVFKQPVENYYNEFIGRFENLKLGEYLLVQETIDESSFGEVSKVGKMVDRINCWLKSASISYRFTQYQSLVQLPVSFYNVRDFLHYFILNHEDHLLDYYFQFSGGKILGVFMKKQK